MIHVILLKTVSNDRQKVSAMCDIYSFLKFFNLRILCHKSVFFRANVFSDFKSVGWLEFTDEELKLFNLL